MRRTLAIVLLMTTFESGRAVAGMCSSRDGQKYCSCDFNQMCTSSETSCACMRDSNQPQMPVLTPPPPRSSQQSATRVPDLQRREPAPPATPAPPPPAITDNGERTPAEYVQLAKIAIADGRLGAAIEFIDKGQTRLLDRSVVLNRTFDPITDEPIKQLAAAKQSLVSRNRDHAVKSLDAALAAMH
jgi:hypothetical protein